MRRSLPTILAVLACGLVAACASPGYVRAWRACHEAWVQRIPPDFRQVLTTRERSVEVPDGTETCTTVGGTRRCEKGMRVEWIPYTVAETVDVNARRREPHVRSCAARHCIGAYGNPDCRP
ncbi:hypothetical protein GCM10017083_33080 [Thalassobaculum fulvum]|uniref:Lipoprotein n=1 Tax=Thalassobaculum fulvum TaxID=1633335 RepID=A0A918XU99_9PROT|nr:hypothetical protein [Thalassobaculum fulvum]GHD54809.1 hypothetical protein GCM10017083_33080 [Thalassobaculum fulvum]